MRLIKQMTNASLKKYLVFTIIASVFINNNSFSQNRQEKNLIRNFLKDLFNESVPPQKVVKKYLVYSLVKNEGGVVGYESAVGHIKQTRKDINKDSGWMMPNYKVANLKHRYIAPYKSYQYLDKNKFFNAVDESFKNEIYVLLNDDKSEILQYFQIKDKRIRSFSLFVKPGQAYFFCYE